MSVDAEALPVKNQVTFHRTSGIRKFKNGLAAGTFFTCFLIALAPLIALLYMVIAKGIGQVSRLDWWQKSMYRASDLGGGVYHAIIGSILQAATAALISVPLGILCAILLVEYAQGTKFGRLTTFMVDVLSGVPSIVAALFVYGVWISIFGFNRTSFAVSLALVLLMVPVVIRSTEEMLKLVPDELREASYALGIPKWVTILRIVVPTALSGMMSGLFLAVARVIGETAPVLLLGFATDRINFNIFEGSMQSLPLFIFQVWKGGPDYRRIPSVGGSVDADHSGRDLLGGGDIDR